MGASSHLPVLPMPLSASARDPQRIADYRTRDHAVGEIAFDGDADLEIVSEHVSALLRAFAPKEGLRVRAGRGSRTEVLASRFTGTASVRAPQLAKGGTLEMSAQHLEPVNGRVVSPLFWIASRPATLDDDHELVSLRFGFCIARPVADAAQRAIAHAVQTFGEACAALEGCVSVVITAQGPPLTLSSSSFPYEALVGTSANAERAEWLRTHVRSPGWLVLVPRARARDVGKSPPGVLAERVRGGLLAQLDTETPFAATDTEAMERWLLPTLR